MQVCYAIVDEMYGKVAKFDKDPHWGTYSLDLPYTEAALVHKIPNYKGSTMNIVVPPREQVMVFGSAEEPPIQESEHSHSYVQNVFARYCCCCPIPCAPPLNK
ncbi:hypothetical protein X975_17130, partial [Stegodyphus mimosarum]